MPVVYAKPLKQLNFSEHINTDEDFITDLELCTNTAMW